MTSNKDKRLEYLKSLDTDYFWYKQADLGRKEPRKLTYQALEYNGDIILLDNKDILTLIDNNTFKKVANPIKKSLRNKDLSNFTDFVFDTEFTGPCTFVIVKETNSVNTTYSYAVSHVIDPLEPGSKHDYLMTSIYEDLNPNMVAEYTMIAGELRIRWNKWNQLIEINFISTATSSQLVDIGFESDKKKNWLKPKINIDDIDGGDKKEWDYYWGIFNLVLQYLKKGLKMDTTNVSLPTKLRGKDFSLIQNKVTKETLSKWQRNNVKLYKRIVYPTPGVSLSSFDLKYMHDKEAVDSMVYYINLCEFQNQDQDQRCKKKNLNLQDLIDKKLIEPYDINKRKYEIPNERPTKRQKRWSPRLLMILGDVPSNEVLSFNLKF